MRIVSLEKDPEIVNDDEAIQVMRINENGDAVEVALEDDDVAHRRGVRLLQREDHVLPPTHTPSTYQAKGGARWAGYLGRRG